MRNFVIELSGKWIFEHRADDVLPVAYLQNVLEKTGSVKVKKTSLTELVVEYLGDAESVAFESFLRDAIKERYPDEIDECELIVREEITEASEDSQSAGGMAGLFDDEPSESAAAVAADGQAARDKAVKEALGRIDALVGAEEFKALAKEVATAAPELAACGITDALLGTNYLFSIGDGCGLTTYLALYDGLLRACGVLKGRARPVEELRLDAVKSSDEPFEAINNLLAMGDKDSPKLVCVDISEWMNSTDDHYFKRFLRRIEKHMGEYIFVFRVPFVDKDILGALRESLGDVLGVRAVSFPPMSQEELIGCAKRELEAHGFKADAGAWGAFAERMAEEKKDGRFYGLNTVKKAVRELLYRKALKNAGKKKRSMRITCADMSELVPNGAGEQTAEQMLNSLVGSEGIRKKIDEIVAQIELADKAGDKPCIHMRFVGNPGTGKTTVARIIGKMLKEKGILSAGNFYEYSGRDLCGRYVGETAPKTASICRDAYGSVLFIDEAYTLYRGSGDWADYGREAIDTLIAEMENHRSDLVVIMAGYTDDMEKLMESNAGLRSRMPYTVEFPNFTGEQLYEIFMNMTGKRFAVSDDLSEAAKAYFTAIPEETLGSKEFGNARFVRNVFERTWAKAAMRSQLAGEKAVVLTKDDFERACADKDLALTGDKKMRKIGF